MTRMKEIANRYAQELDAQFGMLNFFTRQGGEIGRAHESFLRSVFQRFLPGKLECGTGFIASATGVSQQQDIIIYNPSSHPLLFKAGDCLVVDSDAVIGAIEVKTRLGSAARTVDAIDHALRARDFTRGFSALYAWDGLSLDSLLDLLWDKYRAADELSQQVAPHAIYMRGQYLLVLNQTGHRNTPPLRVLKIGKHKHKHSEGDALISLVAYFWLGGIQMQAQRPWWIEERDENENQFFENVDWPSDLKERAEREERACQSR